MITDLGHIPLCKTMIPAQPADGTTWDMRNYLAAIAAAIVTCALGACGHSGTTVHPSGQATPAATATATSPAGCQQASLLIAAVRENLRANPGGTATALHQITALGKSLPEDQLRLDVDRAALDLALFRQYAADGGPATRAAKHFNADLNRIQAYCAK